MNCWRPARGLPPCEDTPVILELPDRRQSDSYSCGAVCARVVTEYHGARGKKPRASPVDGTDPRALETALWLSGLSVQAGSMDVDDLRHHTRKGRPVICLVTEPEPSGVGHWVTVCGVSRGFIFYQCPLLGPSRESTTLFISRWRDVDRLGVQYIQWGIASG